MYILSIKRRAGSAAAKTVTLNKPSPANLVPLASHISEITSAQNLTRNAAG
jgi:hypothetical protein